MAVELVRMNREEEVDVTPACGSEEKRTRIHSEASREKVQDAARAAFGLKEGTVCDIDRAGRTGRCVPREWIELTVQQQRRNRPREARARKAESRCTGAKSR
jgi:hypothetical protein